MNKKYLLAVPAILIVIGCGSVDSSDSDKDTSNKRVIDAPPAATVTPNKTTVKPTVSPTAAKKTIYVINGDDLVHVGEDVPAGTYRMVEAVTSGDLCYWKKAKDAEGSDIIDNALPTGGRSQVTLKKGQWFTSQGCPDWQKKG